MDTVPRKIEFPILIDGRLETATADEMLTYLKGAGQPTPVTPRPDKEPVSTAVKRTDFLGAKVGHRAGNDVYYGTDGNWYYELAGDAVLPRGTNMTFDLLVGMAPLKGNDCPISGIGVPKKYTLPGGWGWAQFGDKAWYIVPKKTELTGPDWLTQTSDTAPAINNPAKSSLTTDWEIDKSNQSETTA